MHFVYNSKSICHLAVYLLMHNTTLHFIQLFMFSKLLFGVFFLFSTCTVICQSLHLLPFASGFNQPTDIAHTGTSDLYIVERQGIVYRVDSSGITTSTPFLNITDRVVTNSGERGLLGLVFHPQYPDSAYIYCNYTGSGGATYIARFDVLSNSTADSTSELVILTYSQPFSNHNGGDLEFDDDGHLYIASGDGGSGGDPLNYAQNKNTLLGKILRIDVDNGTPYTIPPTNPLVGQANVREEIWAYGLRNPWRIDFDSATQALYVADVGQNAWEEINKINMGILDPNFGWRCYEATHPYNLDSCEGITPIDPIHEYAHRLGGGCTASITGGKLYRGTDMPAFYGKYFYADYCTGFIGLLDVNTLQNDTLVQPSSFRFSTFGEDARKRLYIAERNSGIIYQLATDPPTDFIFTINLDGGQASTPSTATGYGIATLDSVNRMLNVSGQFTDLIGNVTAAHVHVAPAGMNGPVAFPLSITNYGTDSIGFYGSGVLTTSEATALLANDGLYVNIHSSVYTAGEIRGQLTGVTCPEDYEIHAPLIPKGLYKVKGATSLGTLSNNQDVFVKYAEDVTLQKGFELSLGATLEITWEVCGD